MSNMTVQDIIRETESLVQQKTAAFKKQAIAGGDGSDMPGAECDKPVPASAGAANPEVKQELPPNGTSAAGAEDAEKIESGHATDSTQPSGESVTKKPLDSADANAKCASDDGQAELANTLLSRIRAHQEKTAAAEKQASEKEEPKKEEPKKEETPEKEASEETPEKEASEETPVEVELTTDVLAKIASVILSTEEGIEFTESQLTKAAGAEAALETMDFLQKQAAYEQGQADAEAMIYQLAQAKQAEEAQKQAAAQGADYSVEDLYKAGQALADELLAAEGGGDLGTGEEGGEVVDDIAAPEGDMDFTPEELQQAIALLVESGQIDEATAAAIMEAVGGGAGAPVEEPMPEEAPMEEPMPEEEAGMEAAASADQLESKILDAIKQVKSKSE